MPPDIFGGLYPQGPQPGSIDFYQMGNTTSPTAAQLAQNAQIAGVPLNNGTGIFGQNGILNPTNLQGITQGLGAFTSLAQIYGMFQNLGLQKKAFRFAQEGTKRNFNAQATAFNEAQASKETARRASAAARGQDYNSLYAYGTGEKVEKWT